MTTGLLDLVCVGVITSPHGIQGMVLVKSFTQIPSDIMSYHTLLDEEGKKIPLKFGRENSKEEFLAHIEGVNTRNDTEQYRRIKLYVLRKDLPKADDRFYYHVDLLECQAHSIKGLDLGKITSVFNFGAGDLIEVSDGKESYLVPFNPDAVPVIDLEKKIIQIEDDFLCGRK